LKERNIGAAIHWKQHIAVTHGTANVTWIERWPY